MRRSRHPIMLAALLLGRVVGAQDLGAPPSARPLPAPAPSHAVESPSTTPAPLPESRPSEPPLDGLDRGGSRQGERSFGDAPFDSSTLPSYPQTELLPLSPDYGQWVETQGWPVAIPFEHYPQGAVFEDGSGLYPCLLPTESPDRCFCTPPPCYFGTFYVAGVVMDRRTNLRPAGLIYDAGMTTELANTSEFNLDPEAGFRFGVWCSHPCGIDWNLEFTSVGNFVDTVRREDVATLNAPFFGGVFATPPTALVAEYTSSLDSFEFGLRARQCPRWAPRIGIRTLQLEEGFHLLTDVSNRSGFFSNTDNELFGFQFGVQALIHQWSCSRLETTIQAGPYLNDIDVDATYTTGGQTVLVENSTNATAFVGDLRVHYVYQLGPRVNFRVGYQAFWIDGVALAVNQNTTRNFQPAISTYDLSDVLYQGGEIGFDVSW